MHILQRASQILALCDRILSDVARGLNQSNSRVQRQDLLKSCGARWPLRKTRVEIVQPWRGARNHGERLRLAPSAETGLASHGKDRWKRGVRASATQNDSVSHAASPASGWNAAQLDRLPLILLVGMREEIVGSLNSSVDVIGLADERFYQGADVSQDRQIIGIVVACKLPGRGVHAVRARTKSHKRILREGKPAHRLIRSPGVLVGCKPAVHRHDEVVRVIPAKQKYANERLVTSARRSSRQRGHHAETAESGKRAQGRRRTAAQTDEIPSCVWHGSFSFARGLFLTSAPGIAMTKRPSRQLSAPGPSDRRWAERSLQ